MNLCRLKFHAFALISAACLAGLSAHADTSKRIALTYDDAPRADTAMTGDDRAAMPLSGLEAAGVDQAAFFVVTSNVLMVSLHHYKQLNLPCFQFIFL